MKLLLADDHTLFRDMLVEYVNRAEPTAKVTLAKDFHQALQILEKDSQYDLILLDLRMPGMNGMNGFKEMHIKYPALRVALMSGTAETHEVEQAVDSGAIAYFPKTMSAKAMMRAIELVLTGEKFVPIDSQTNKLMASFLADPEQKNSKFPNPAAVEQYKLTSREYEVLQHIAKGDTNKDIATDLGVKIVTVKLHMRNICKKLGVKNRTQAALKARDLGMVE